MAAPRYYANPGTVIADRHAGKVDYSHVNCMVQQAGVQKLNGMVMGLITIPGHFISETFLTQETNCSICSQSINPQTGF
jgi:hypothetical protein